VRYIHIEIVYSQQTIVQAAHWQPTLSIPEHLGSGSVGLVTLEIFPLKLPQLSFSLDAAYKVTRILPRSYFGVLCQCHIQHSFVFNLLDQNSVFFQELAGMRQSVAVPIVSNDSEKWELHLKPSKGYELLMKRDFWIFGKAFGARESNSGAGRYAVTVEEVTVGS
jgi:hypothetical protein